ncbi:MAG TPA: alpha/beta fold hydrolase [Gallionella sp.]
MNTRFDAGDLSFAEYIARCREMIARVHAGRHGPDLERIVAGNAPFELMPTGPDTAGKHRKYRRGVLLIHGLTDSPYLMRHLAAFFQRNGFRVMAILLPGHGTQPGDLLDVRWRDWSDSVAYGTDRLAEEADEIYLVGYSAGGALSVYQSLFDDRVRGLFLFAPALRVSPRAAYANLHKLYSWLIPSARWVDIKPDRDIYKYESFSKNAAAQMHALTRAIGHRMQDRRLNIPVFAAASRDDVTVDVSATLEFMARASHPASKLMLYSTDIGDLPSGIAAEKIELISSAIPQQRILGSAHTAIVQSPADAHYGRAGEYASCQHYFPDDMEKYTACIAHPESAQEGELTEANLASGLLRRLTYNPAYDALELSMKRFIERLS